MTARLRRRRAVMGLGVALFAGCPEPDDDGSGGMSTTPEPPVRDDEPDPDEACAIEGERRCGLEGEAVHVCEGAEWVRRTCYSECRALDPPACSLGCLIAEDGEDCLCAPCG